MIKNNNSLIGQNVIRNPVVNGDITLVDGAINNNFCCQLVSSDFQIITPSYTYVKLNKFIPTPTWGFENGLSGVTNKDMYVGSNQITIVKAGKYLIKFKGYLGASAITSTMILGRNGSPFDTAFQLVNEGYSGYIHFVMDCAVGDTISAYCAVAVVGLCGGSSTFQINTLFVGLIN